MIALHIVDHLDDRLHGEPVENGKLTVQNVKNGTLVNVYNTNGTQVGSTISQNGQATIYTNLQSGSVAIVKIGKESFKVMIK